VKLAKLRSIPEIARLYSLLKTDFESEIYTAALRNFCSMGNPIRFNNFSFVMRELLTNIVDRLAPVKEVKNAKWYKKIKNSDYEVTRKQQLQFCAQGFFLDSNLPPWAKEDTAQLIHNYLDLYGKLNRYTHISKEYIDISHEDAFSFLMDLVVTFSSIIALLTEIKEHIKKAIEQSVHDVIFNELVFTSHEALMELSGQTIVEGVYIEDYFLSTVEPSRAIFEGQGYVECELNYGSGDDGATLHHTVPFLFFLSSDLNNLSELDFHGEGLKLDNSDFYE